MQSGLKGKRGRAFLSEMLAAMDAMPIKQLAKDELETTNEVSFSHWGMIEAETVCAIGTVGKARGVDMGNIDPDDYSTVAGKFGIATAMAQEIVFINDEAGSWRETPEERFARVRSWIVSELASAKASAVSGDRSQADASEVVR